MRFELPILPYSYDSLEPFFDKKTMEIHHKKHHQAYVNNTNSIIENTEELQNLDTHELIEKIKIDKIPENKKTIFRNNFGGHINHKLFWTMLKKGTILTGELKIAIDKNFKNFSCFKKKFESISLSHFGSGWSWLIKREDGSLSIDSTSNQDNPIMGGLFSNISGLPILGLDLWEHAYYLKYQNNRLDYIKSFWNVIDWNEANDRFVKNKIPL